jgi:translation elongation factor EF-Ts
MLTTRLFVRSYATAATATARNPALAMVSKLRNDFPGLPVKKAKEALDANDNDYDKAVAFVREQMAQDGSIKAAKVQSRQCSQGVVSVLERPGIGAALIEVSKFICDGNADFII